MIVRPLRPEDAEAAFQLRVVAFSTAMHADFDPDEPYAPDDGRLVAVEDSRVVGHLAIWPFHQAFGGRAVPMGGVAGVVVAPDRRGQGIASRLLAAALDRMGEHGQAISTLFPATTAPYRRWGWEVAGTHLRRRVATRDLLALPAPSTEVSLRPFELDDLDAVVALHDAVTLTEPGGLVAGRPWLHRALAPDPDEPEIVVVAEREARVAGLLLATKLAAEDPHSAYTLDVLRLFGADRDIERALWRNVAGHYSVAATTTFKSQPAEPLLFELPFGLHEPVPAPEHFMTRLVDVPAAMAARGWPGVDVHVELAIRDERRPANDGHWVVELAGGEATTTPGGGGDVEVDIGALSSLYTGFTTPRALARSGRLRASEAQLDRLTAMFSAPSPFLRDYF